MKLIAMIPLSEVVNDTVYDPGFVLVKSQGFLKVYKVIR